MNKAYKYRGGRGILDKDGMSIFEFLKEMLRLS